MKNIYGVGAVIIKNKMLLLIKRAKPPVKFYWNVPGGKISKKESSEKALKRELKEELGINAIIGKQCYKAVTKKNGINWHIIVFYCSVKNLKLKPDKNEVMAWRFLSYKEAHKLKLTDHVKKVLLPKLKNKNLIA